MLLELVILGATLAVGYLVWSDLSQKIAREDVRGPSPKSFITGNLTQMFAPYGWDWHRDMFRTYGRVIQLRGWFGAKWLYVCDPKALQIVLIKDQESFEETEFFLLTNRLAFGNGLLATEGQHHRKQRKALNPVFSTNHMRNTTAIVYPIANKLRDLILEEVESGNVEIDMLKWMSRAAVEIIGQAGLGYSFENLNREASANPYTVAVKDFVPTMVRLNLFRQMLPILVKLGPPKLLRKLANRLPSENAQKMLRIVDTMGETAEAIFRKKKAEQENGLSEKLVDGGKDIFSVLLRVNEEAAEEDRLPDSEIIGQINTFLFAGSDTTTSALGRTLWALASHPEAQQKLRDEVTQVRREGGDLPYDELFALPYLDAVCRETLRLYSPMSTVKRIANQDVVLSLAFPITSKSGKEVQEVHVQKGTQILVGIFASNRDPEIWGPDAEEWKPERWLNPLPKSVEDAHLPAIYSNMMTFLGGHRSCIGFKFALLEMKVVLSVLLESFAFSPPDAEVVWSMASISTPATKGNERKPPHLPMKVVVVPQA